MAKYSLLNFTTPTTHINSNANQNVLICLKWLAIKKFLGQSFYLLMKHASEGVKPEQSDAHYKTIVSVSQPFSPHGTFHTKCFVRGTLQRTSLFSPGKKRVKWFS